MSVYLTRVDQQLNKVDTPDPAAGEELVIRCYWPSERVAHIVRLTVAPISLHWLVGTFHGGKTDYQALEGKFTNKSNIFGFARRALVDCYDQNRNGFGSQPIYKS